MTSARLGKYQILAELGSDGVADVSIAKNPESVGPKKVVLKRLRRDVENAELVRALIEEARVVAAIEHPNLTQILDVGEDGADGFLVTEVVEGQSLEAIRAHPAREDVFPTNLEYFVLSQVLTGLHFGHEAKRPDGTALGMVHGRLSPRHVFVTYEGHVKVADFGFSRWARRGRGARVGNERYLSPEQARGLAAERRADLFSVGIMLWEAATGLRFWGDATGADILDALRVGALPNSVSRGRPIPFPIQEICNRALAPSPADRRPDAAAMQRDLEDFLVDDELTRTVQLRGALEHMFARPPVSRSRSGPARTGPLASEPPMLASNYDVPSLFDDDDDQVEDAATTVGVSFPPKGLPELKAIALEPPLVPSLLDADDDLEPMFESDALRSVEAPVPVPERFIPVLNRAENDDRTAAGFTKIVPDLAAGQLLSAVVEASERSRGPLPASALSEDEDEATRVGPQPPDDQLHLVQQRIEELEKRLEEKSLPAPPFPTRRARAARALAVGATVMVVGLVGVSLARRSPQPSTPDPPLRSSEASSASAAEAPSAPLRKEMVALTMTASPASARFRIDHGAWLHNPYTGRAPRGDDEHTIEIVAEGYSPRATKVRFSADVILEVALEKPGPATVRFASPAERRGAPSALPSTSRPSSGGPKRGTLDQNDPWK